ncbi:protein-L-isoaspartate O-methyltransferase family protein [Phyllobacterium myrsinacearum]|uniref:Protein-L-isoaspartate O-methyltransferase n=1 Tax=Phyllobacterium myrsinacearum TaxID=28101 RepID=A0A2S9J9Z3_9HYPH|nr:methyltransferase domain-containing protein [Phyllobacterium myrsinacearum]PRD49564.1 protein-L-isoaspartate O-methyltransferase [Phyllobacterium myrsinacearum]PWV83558.1 protein-L-isoaspartate(D-aspartate) O-methyltransferase [Phyllobacterium myrsinacearum]RZU96840.1 protein-L-isoaspartate(D-aspartate) O-methyltransferase [Phyllobacterium myrsinacearum]
MTPDELKIVRRAYAMQIAAAAGIADKAVEDAFAAMPREDFLGPGPWPVLRWQEDYTPTPGADPVYLYTDSLVGILPERHINNGQPSLHAFLLSQSAPRKGEHIVHIGAGTGYYSAIMAQLAGPSGRVTAIEYDPELAARARANLAAHANVSVLQGDGSKIGFEAADLIYVNAGATKPADIWLDRLKEGGRLILPLTTEKGFSSDWSKIHRRGGVFLITREAEKFWARWISPVAIYPCEGMRDAASEKVLARAFESSDYKRVTRLYRSEDIPAERCWLRAPGWSLAYA